MAGGLKIVCWLSVIGLLPWCSNGQGFLGYNPKLDAARVQKQIQDTVAEAFGSGHSIKVEQLKAINSTIAPMFAAMPKDAKGRVGTGMLRYTVHRYFSEVHNWVVRGFEPHANISEPSGAKILRSELPLFAEAVIEKQLSHGGFALGDVVSAVAVIEQLVLNEVLQAVYSSYSLNNIPISKALSRKELLQIMHSFIIVDLLEGNPDDKAQHASDKKNIHEIYPNWDETSLFLEDLVANDKYQHKGSYNPFQPHLYQSEDIARIAQSFTQEFSHWADHECKSMKANLVERDVHGTGRIRLADFYRKSQDGAWQFLESTDYLRQLGALDESSTFLGPQVIIPNYMTGMSNCISSTPFYAACCMNECVALMSELESRIRVSDAPPADIARAVAQMSSSTVMPRNLSTALLGKLDEVANFHGGKVPLHGRLLAQWMHYAFPHECPFPHVSGTVNPLTPGQWMQLNDGDEGVAGQDEIDRHLNSSHAKGLASPEAGISMWVLHEELLETHHGANGHGAKFREILRTGVLLMMIGCMVFFVTQHVSHIRSFMSGGEKGPKEYIV